MTGYKTYNSVSQQWEYYEIPKTNTQNRYNEVQQVDTDYMIKGLQYANAKSSRNYKRLENEINTLINTINDKAEDEEYRDLCHKNFKECVDEINSKKIDLSSDNMTNRAINYLYTCFNSSVDSAKKVMEDRKAKLEVKTPTELVKFYGGYNIVTIREYIYENEQYKLINTDTNTNSVIYFSGDVMLFQRGSNSAWKDRPLVFKTYDSEFKRFTFNSIYGTVIINLDFKSIIFYDDISGRNNGVIKAYEYVVGNYDKNIKPYK
jgi:hypothetical protein